jgi:hypothetical protein
LATRWKNTSTFPETLPIRRIRAISEDSVYHSGKDVVDQRSSHLVDRKKREGNIGGGPGKM